ncbi:sulfite exporter TauE/SafE family protein [Gilvimarinus chinensis]|uniref:sulfite exporter TauE/SafE family protein n=1 Tax=Gilvimarinus chinensis TaxID=396005 RepID=UPI00036C7ADA|nr:sulfite exporter TauE/SafE family protein [Gilvimarinus chinensis]
MELFITPAIGVVIGLVLGLTGAGGSVFAVPLLIILLQLPMQQASGMALAAVATSALYGSLRNRGSHQILWIPALALGAGGVISAPLGQWLAQQIPELWLLLGFNGLAIIIAARMYVSAIRAPQDARVVRVNPGVYSLQAPLCRLSPSGQFQLRPRCIAGMAIGGLTVGLLSGLFGVGGGFLIVPLLLFLSRIGMSQAVATSLIIIAVISSAGFISYWQMGGTVDTGTLANIAAGGIAGMVLGQWINGKIDHVRKQKIFAVSLVAISIVSLFS